MMGEKSHKYKNDSGYRDVVFVFGAGASYADGAPLQAEILPIILSGASEDIKKSATGKAVRKFIEDNFAWDDKAKIYPTLESVFGFLDYFINQGEHLSAAYPNMEISAIKERLIKLIHFVISEKANPQAIIYRSFWEVLLRHHRNVSILTLNYDTLLEEAFRVVCPESYYIDYFIHFMNYDLRHEMTWVNPQEHLSKFNGGAHGVIKIMKAHGSLNWKYCHCCNQVLLTPWESKVDLSNGGVAQNYGHAAAGSGRYCCPIDGSAFETLIIPPSHVKRISHPVISQILNESLREVRSCKKIVFVGYSFPDADVHFKALFRKGLLNGQQIYVVNRTIEEKLRINYLALSKGVNFIESSFEDFINNGFLAQQILQ